ncbi:MAG: hypothetical protein HDR43_02775 [Mycoplasma sp.]|nr:hypothetical protein [Mycoplasma sp.]
MIIFIVITYKINFSQEIISYFKSQNICNGYNFNFIPIGLDEGDDEEILNKIYKKLNDIKNLETVVVFSDVGLPTKLAKRIEIKDNNIELFRAKGSLIENGYLSYIMLNTKAPKETIEQVINDKIEKY